MQLPTELEATRLLPTFQDFAALVGSEYWLRMVDQLQAEIRGNPFLEHLYRTEHRMVFALKYLHSEYENYQHVMPSQHPDLYEASTLVVQFVEIVRSHHDSAKALIGRMRGALKNPSDMRAMQFELQVATHLARKGYSVSFPELDGTGQFDILAVQGDQHIEFECKYATAIKGRAVTRHAAIGIHHKIKGAIDLYAQAATDGTILRVMFDGRAPVAPQQQAKLAEHVAEALRTGRYDDESIEIVAVAFDIAESPFSRERPAENDIKGFLERHGSINTECMALVYPNGVVVLVSLESKRESQYLELVFGTLSDAAKRQLTGEHPAVLCTKFEDLTADEMVDIGKEADGVPSALRVRASRFLDSSSSDHVTMLCFFADGALLKQGDHVITRGGAVFSFRNARNKFSRSDLSSIFS